MRAWWGQGEVALLAGASNSNPPLVGFFGIFLAETRKIPAGGIYLFNVNVIIIAYNARYFYKKVVQPKLHHFKIVRISPRS